MGAEVLGFGLKRLDQRGEGVVELGTVGEGDPVVGRDGLGNQAVGHLPVQQRQDPLVGGRRVGGLLTADRGFNRVRRDHEAEAVGLIDRGSDLGHPLGRRRIPSQSTHDSRPSWASASCRR